MTGHPTLSNTTEFRPNFVTHLECGLTRQRFEPGKPHGLSEAGKPLLVRYDLEALGSALSREAVAERPADLWRYREFLPVVHAENVISLGESTTPLLPAPRLGQNLWIKDEGRLPTGSFKARGLCMAVSMAKELGIKRIAMPTNGNAGAALAAYASSAGIEAFVFCPEDTPEVNVREIAMQGAKVWRVNGLIHDCGRIVREGAKLMDWFDLSTLKEPYRIEGKKTMGLELAEQLGWRMPEVIFYPTGGGTGLIGMWKAFAELAELGWVGGSFPKMIAVQATGCAPIVRAFEEGAPFAAECKDAHTIASGIRVPVAVGDFLILRAIRESGGLAIAVDDDAIQQAQVEAARREGILLCPEGAATLAAYWKAVAEGVVATGDEVVLFNCGSGLKYPMPPAENRIDLNQPIDWAAMQGELSV